jgi:hypothetical protein
MTFGLGLWALGLVWDEPDFMEAILALDEIARRDAWVERKNAPAPRAARG